MGISIPVISSSLAFRNPSGVLVWDAAQSNSPPGLAFRLFFLLKHDPSRTPECPVLSYVFTPQCTIGFGRCADWCVVYYFRNFFSAENIWKIKSYFKGNTINSGVPKGKFVSHLVNKWSKIGFEVRAYNTDQKVTHKRTQRGSQKFELTSKGYSTSLTESSTWLSTCIISVYASNFKQLNKIIMNAKAKSHMLKGKKNLKKSEIN